MSSTDDQDGGELAALKGLLESDGWQAFTQHVEQTWGPAATLQRIEAGVSKVPLGDQDAVHDMTQHVLSAQKQIKTLVQWPSDRIAQLSAGKQSKQPFAALRRIGR